MNTVNFVAHFYAVLIIKEEVLKIIQFGSKPKLETYFHDWSLLMKETPRRKITFMLSLKEFWHKIFSFWIFFTNQFPSWPWISYWSPFKCLRKFAHIFKSKPFKEPSNRFPAWQTGMTTLLVLPFARLHRLEASIPWNRFMDSINVYKYGLRSLL
jgi:hypothetical protein